LSESHVMVPLEQTYQATRDASPEELRIAVETGLLPESEGECATSGFWSALCSNRAHLRR
jgi:hypothetical protein